MYGDVTIWTTHWDHWELHVESILGKSQCKLMQKTLYLWLIWRFACIFLICTMNLRPFQWNWSNNFSLSVQCSQCLHCVTPIRIGQEYLCSTFLSSILCIFHSGPSHNLTPFHRLESFRIRSGIPYRELSNHSACYKVETDYQTGLLRSMMLEPYSLCMCEQTTALSISNELVPPLHAASCACQH